MKLEKGSGISVQESSVLAVTIDLRNRHLAEFLMEIAENVEAHGGVLRRRSVFRQSCGQIDVFERAVNLSPS